MDLDFAKYKEKLTADSLYGSEIHCAVAEDSPMALAMGVWTPYCHLLQEVLCSMMMLCLHSVQLKCAEAFLFMLAVQGLECPALARQRS